MRPDCGVSIPGRNWPAPKVGAQIPRWYSSSTTNGAPGRGARSRMRRTSPLPRSSASTTSSWSRRTLTRCTSAPARRRCCTCTANCLTHVAPARPRQRYRIDGAPIELGQLCEEGTQLRPDIVWFGEETQFMERGARARRRRRQGAGSWDLAQRLSRGFAGRCGERRRGQGPELAGDGRCATGLRFPSRARPRACCPASSRDG